MTGKKIAVLLLASFIGTGTIGTHTAKCEDYSYEACDGEVVIMEPIRETYYIFEDRSFDDLANQKLVTEDDMEYLIEHYEKLHPNTAFHGCALSFIQASNKTGMDPLFFFALAGIESAWGTNETHISQHNPYSLGMFGDGVHTGYTVADTFADGIVEGANYIYENYYKKGQKTLYQMNHVEDHSYCAGDTNWEFQIGSEMAYLETLLNERHKKSE